MKSRLTQSCFAAALVAVMPSILHAQDVMRTAEEIFISGHFFFFTPSSVDLAIIDRATGQVRALNNGAGAVASGLQRLSGVGEITEAASGLLGRGGSTDSLMLASNRSQSLVRVTPASLAPVVVYESPRPAPAGVVALDFPTPPFPSSANDDLWVSSHDVSQSSLSAVVVGDPSLTTAVSSNRSVRLREGRRARVSTSDPWYAAFMADDLAGSILQMFSGVDPGGSPSINLEIQLSGMPLGASFVWGALDATTRSTFVFFVPGSPTLHWIRTTSSGSAIVSNTFNASAGVESLMPVNQGTAHGVWAILDGGSQMQLLQFDGTGFTVAQALVAPAGQRWTGGIAGDGGSQMLMLQGPTTGGGSTSWERFDVQGDGTYNSESQGSLPALAMASPAHVFAFDGEPFVDSDAVLTDSRRNADWTLGTGPLPGSLAMDGERESFGGSSAGLGGRSPFSAGTAAAGSTWMLTNQYSDDTSVFAVLPGTLSPTEPTVTIVPAASHEVHPPGALSPPVVRSYRFESTADVWYRESPTASFNLFQSGFPDREFAVATAPASVTIEYYAKSGTQRSRIDFATYSFGVVDPVTAPSSIDADGNGLADEWEAWYGITDPNGDADNDGINNITEQNIGSDPLGHCGEDALPLDLTIEVQEGQGPGDGATVHVFLTRALHAGETLQSSIDLESWSDLTLLPGSLEYSALLSDAPLRFFQIDHP